MVSSDGSFTPPEISAPTLVLRASYGADHGVEVGWEWAYQVGATARRAALGTNGDGPGFRDLDAERAILADTVLAGTGLERFGLLDDAGRPADAPAVSLTGIDSMRLTTEDAAAAGAAAGRRRRGRRTSRPTTATSATR